MFGLSHFDWANVGFFLAFCGLLVKDILFLRLLLLSSHGTLLTVGLVTGNETLVFWHTIFVSINSARTVLLFWERRKISFPPELETVYKDFWTALSRKEALNLWQISKERTFTDEKIIRQAEILDRMHFILEGTAEVFREGRKVSQLERGRFMGEMSFITGQGASADVCALRTIRVRTWGHTDLRPIQMKNPVLWAKVQGLIGKDLVQKVYEHHINLR